MKPERIQKNAPLSKMKPERIQRLLQDHPTWALEENRLVRAYAFPTAYVAATFVSYASALAEAMEVEPEIILAGRLVEIRVSGSDGLDELGVEFVRALDRPPGS